jgi:phosphate acetyltransferase
MLSARPVECPARLLEQAVGLRVMPTAIVNAGGHLPMESARLATEENLIDPVFVGQTHSIKQQAKNISWDISGFRIEDAADETAAANRAVELAAAGEVSCLMKGDVHTDTLLRAVLNRAAGLRTDASLTHIFHMTVPDSQQVLCITDAVVNVLPNIRVKMDIVRHAVQLMHAIGTAQPRIALLSATEQASSAMPSSVDAEEISNRAASGEIKGAHVDGPFAFDNAISPEAARLKGRTGKVAGRADVLVVPNIETGNALFKQMVYFMSAAAAGLVMGARVPIILNSRADPAPARLASVALAAIVANRKHRQEEP